MDAIDIALTQLRVDEGFRSRPYRDTVGKLTIGYGRNLDDVGISRSEGEYLLRNDVEEVIDQLKSTFGFWDDLSELRKAVLINMAFNLGFDGLMGFHNTLKHIRAGEFEDASEHMLHSKWARQVGARADRLAEAMRKG